ncbi:beta-mannosidase [Streptomyces badius]
MLWAVTGDRPNVYPEPFQYIRKMASSFGWDGRTLVTAGIWRPVRQHWSTARLAAVQPLVTVDEGTGSVEIRLQVQRTDRGAGRSLLARATVAGEHAEVRFEGETAVLRLTVDEPRLWAATRVRGPSRCIDLDLPVRRGRATGRLAPAHRLPHHRTGPGARRAGLRLHPRRERRARFRPGRQLDPRRRVPLPGVPRALPHPPSQAVEANVDLVRIWGGGIYEDDAFYDVCDELGLMVWQDFLFACAAYPEEQPLRGEVEAEARDNVVRLMPHPAWSSGTEQREPLGLP